MSVGPHVFGDGRLGCWINSVGSVSNEARLLALRGLGVTDLFLRGPDAQSKHKTAVLNAGFAGCHAWWAVDGLSAQKFAERCLADITRWSPGSGEFNIETQSPMTSDADLRGYMLEVYQRIRDKRPNLRLRFNIAPLKAVYVPMELVQGNANTYLVEQCYGGNMDYRFSEFEALVDMLGAGAPLEKCSVQYAGAVEVDPDGPRVAGLPNYPARLRRGSIFHDDLLAEVGLV